MRSLEEIAAHQVYLASSTDMGEEEFERVSAMSAAEQVGYFYVSGECHAFAAALHRMTGWPVLDVVSPALGRFHRVARAPDGRLLDAKGWTDAAGLRRRYGVRRLTLSEARDPEDALDAMSMEDGILDELADAVAAIRQLPWEPFCGAEFRAMSAAPVEGVDLPFRAPSA